MVYKDDFPEENNHLYIIIINLSNLKVYRIA
nr:MAG TPA: hypothetical protein [Bacteriophage sp.]